MMDLKHILEQHQMWLDDEETGVRADLTGADLRDTDLTRANLSGTDLRDTDLRGADLTGADLRWADLTRANLAGTLVVLYGLTWTIYISKSWMQIGCQGHSIEDWMSFDDEKIGQMAHGALDFWRKNKERILSFTFK